MRGEILQASSGDKVQPRLCLPEDAGLHGHVGTLTEGLVSTSGVPKGKREQENEKPSV